MCQETDDITSSIRFYQHGSNDHSILLNDNAITTVKDLENLDNELAQRREIDQVTTSTTTTQSIDSKVSNTPTTTITNESLLQSASTSSLMSLVGKGARRAFVKMKRSTSGSSNQNDKDGNHMSHDANTLPTILVRPMDKDSIANRLKYASCAIICESDGRSQIKKDGNTKASPMTSKSSPPISTPLVQYELRPPRPSGGKSIEEANREKDKFTIGLQLLQNNIIALSIQAGVPVANLWPAEAMLLNLFSLKLYCLNQIEK